MEQNRGHSNKLTQLEPSDILLWFLDVIYFGEVLNDWRNCGKLKINQVRIRGLPENDFVTLKKYYLHTYYYTNIWLEAWGIYK
jgi:hypothetical protein